MTTRPYQNQAIRDTGNAFRAGHRGVLLRMPTSSGKTVVFSEITRLAQGGNWKTLLLVHRQELLKQTVSKLDDAGVECGVVAAARRALVRECLLPERHAQEHPNAPVQVAMTRSLANRQLEWEPNLIIIDEAHLSMSEGMVALMGRWPKARRLLVTATPERLDGLGFLSLATHMVEPVEIDQLIGLGFLVPSENYVIPGVDLSGVHMKAGEFDAAERFDQTKLVGDVVSHHKRLADGRKTILFASSVAHSKNIVAQFRSTGVKAEHIDGTTPLPERARVLDALRDGDVEVVSNYGVLCEGFDCPPLSCIQVARATASRALWNQMVGRGGRPYPGKRECIIIDHGGNAPRLGFVEIPREWSLLGTKERNTEETAPAVATCPVCFAAFPAHIRVCPRCGNVKVVVVKPERPITQGNLVRVTREEMERMAREARKKTQTGARPCPYGIPEKVWNRLEATRIEKGYKLGWSHYKAAAMVGLGAR